jgi:hypothetical protein
MQGFHCRHGTYMHRVTLKSQSEHDSGALDYVARVMGRYTSLGIWNNLCDRSL